MVSELLHRKNVRQSRVDTSLVEDEYRSISAKREVGSKAIKYTEEMEKLARKTKRLAYPPYSNTHKQQVVAVSTEVAHQMRRQRQRLVPGDMVEHISPARNSTVGDQARNPAGAPRLVARRVDKRQKACTRGRYV